VFDNSHTAAALPDLPCPVLTERALVHIAKWAISSKFADPIALAKRVPHKRQVEAGREVVIDGVALDRPRVRTVTGLGGGRMPPLRKLFRDYSLAETEPRRVKAMLVQLEAWKADVASGDFVQPKDSSEAQATKAAGSVTKKKRKNKKD
ncbi:MAG: hypothetical protein ABI614_29415, partial [Planctomycetota bacterium]